METLRMSVRERSRLFLMGRVKRGELRLSKTAELLVLIDDATNRTYARFFEEETTAAAMETFRRYVEKYGLPQAIYVDRDSIYETTRDATIDEELRETGPLTQFGRAMEELDVKLILAYSPQAKGVWNVGTPCSRIGW